MSGFLSNLYGDGAATPHDTTPDPRTRWTGLQVLAAEGDTVEFVASWEGGRMHEVSRFEQRAGRWVYVDGDVT